MDAVPPLLLKPIFKEKVWGGRALESLAKSLPSGLSIGESWELADLSSTAASGGGGGSAVSIIENGPLAGLDLHAAIAHLGPELMGSVPLTPQGRFPLLVKYLDARENLSVQVHPSPAYLTAHPHAGAHLKTECWFVVGAQPVSEQVSQQTGLPREPRIYKGFKPGAFRGTTPGNPSPEDAVGDAIASGRLVDMLDHVPAMPGECHTLPSGTVHALGAGVLVAEVQTPSDTTFRMYDWTREYRRPVREMHVAESLQSLLFEPPPIATRFQPGAPATRLVDTPFFTVDEVRLAGGQPLTANAIRPRAAAPETPAADDAPVVLMMLWGNAILEPPQGPGVHLQLGRTALLPAQIARATTLHPESDCTLLWVKPRQQPS
ncbi:MAG: type I phosphomannose isomerase catalytic subunit [Planctomycetota bacterium]|nr:type I phosphomannose isomerase catalytic subunit [Planctomycetota bacterium]